jgi:CBS domain-containing protein
MQVKDVMTRGVECARPTDTLEAAAARMKSLDVGVLPVCGDQDRLVGMITDRDVTVRATAEGEDPKAVRVADVMTPEVFYCFEDDDASEAARQMKDKQVRRLVVLNRDKRLAGIVSLGDLAVEGDKRQAADALSGVSEPAFPRR